MVENVRLMPRDVEVGVKSLGGGVAYDRPLVAERETPGVRESRYTDCEADIEPLLDGTQGHCADTLHIS